MTRARNPAVAACKPSATPFPVTGETGLHAYHCLAVIRITRLCEFPPAVQSVLYAYLHLHKPTSQPQSAGSKYILFASSVTNRHCNRSSPGRDASSRCLHTKSIFAVISSAFVHSLVDTKLNSNIHRQADLTEDFATSAMSFEGCHSKAHGGNLSYNVEQSCPDTLFGCTGRLHHTYESNHLTVLLFYAGDSNRRTRGENL